MHYSVPTLAMAIIGFPITMGAPRPDDRCIEYENTYTVTSQEDVAGAAQVGDDTTSGGTGNAQVTFQTTFTTGVTVEVGLSLGLDYETIAGEVSGSVAFTTEKSSTQGITDTCPQGSWHCALIITPTMVKVSGVVKQTSPCGSTTDPQPYTILMPKMGADGNPILSAEACLCTNLAHSDAPKYLPLCPGPCALQNGSS